MHVWKRNTLLSIVGGTICYLFLKTYLDTEDEQLLAKAEEQVAAFSSARFLLGLLRIPNLMTPQDMVTYKARFCALYDKGIEPLCF